MRTAPTNGLYICPGSISVPPIYAKGIDASANGQNKFQENAPARKYFTVAIDATKMFNVNAVGLITSGDIPTIAIAAR